MFGKYFASTFTGSMMGAGPDVFAVWGFVIANTVDSQVELNPILLAAMLGTTVERCQSAIDYLAAPDPRSRSKNDEGRRLIREGEFAYRVPNHAAYREIRHEDDRREYNRIKKAEQRARERVNAPVIDSTRQSRKSAQAEAEAKADTEATSSSGERSLALRLDTDADRMALTAICARVPSSASWVAEAMAALDGMHGPAITPKQLGEALRDYVANDALSSPNFRHFRAYLRRAAVPEAVATGRASDLDQQAATLNQWAKDNA